MLAGEQAVALGAVRPPRRPSCAASLTATARAIARSSSPLLTASEGRLDGLLGGLQAGHVALQGGNDAEGILTAINEAIMRAGAGAFVAAPALALLR